MFVNQPILNQAFASAKILDFDIRNPAADFNELKKAYHKKVLKFHPDKGGDNEIFVKINDAFNFLARFFDPQKTIWNKPSGGGNDDKNYWEKNSEGSCGNNECNEFNYRIRGNNDNSTNINSSYINSSYNNNVDNYFGLQSNISDITRPNNTTSNQVSSHQPVFINRPKTALSNDKISPSPANISQQQSTKTKDISISFDISLSEAYFGVKKSIKIRRNRHCASCNSVPKTDKNQQESLSFPGCSECGGKGYCLQTKEVSFLIRPGIFTGCKIVLKGEAEEYEGKDQGILY